MILKDHQVRLSGEGEDHPGPEAAAQENGNEGSVPGNAQVEFEEEVEESLLPEKADMPFQVRREVASRPQGP